MSMAVNFRLFRNCNNKEIIVSSLYRRTFPKLCSKHAISDFQDNSKQWIQNLNLNTKFSINLYIFGTSLLYIFIFYIISVKATQVFRCCIKHMLWFHMLFNFIAIIALLLDLLFKKITCPYTFDMHYIHYLSISFDKLFKVNILAKIGTWKWILDVKIDQVVTGHLLVNSCVLVNACV